MGAGSQLFYLRIFAVLFSDFLISYKTIKLQRHIFYNDRNTEDPRYNDSVCYQRFCCKIDFAVIKKFEMDASKAWITDTFKQFVSMNHTFCVFVRIASARRF